MRANTQVQLMLDIISCARTLEAGGIDSWAAVVYEAADGITLAPDEYPEDGHAINWQIVARGIWRISGGQLMGRPKGVTEDMAAQLARALSDMDADMLTPATASAVIQVGLFQEVRYRNM